MKLTLDLNSPWGLQGSVLRYRLVLPQQTPSNNEIREMHFRTYKQLRTTFRYLVLKALGSERPASPIARSLLVVRRYCDGCLDWDNALGGLKPLLDCLVVRTQRNPDGLGLITDDSPRSMPLPPFMEQLSAKRGSGSTELFVFELPQTLTIEVATAESALVPAGT